MVSQFSVTADEIRNYTRDLPSADVADAEIDKLIEEVENIIFVTTKKNDWSISDTAFEALRDAVWILFLNAIPTEKGVCHGEEPTIIGTEDNDDLVGTNGPDVIHGLGGNDTIQGLAGDDLICGGDGADKIFGGDGNDIAYGWNGNDFISLGKGNDTAFGGPGDDQLFGGENIDKLFGGEGVDNCHQGEINDKCEAFTIFTILEGAQEVPSVTTDASGGALFVFNATGSELLRFRITVDNLDLDGNQTGDVNDDVTAAHIHLAPFGVNGPIVVGFISPTMVDDLVVDPVKGVITGTITGDSLIADLSGEPLSRLIDEMRSGNTYVNIHTVANPGGEIRGQI